MNPARTISEVEEDTSCCIIQIDKVPELLKVSAGVRSCCIYRIPHTFFEANAAASKPKILSIGPYHHWDGKDGENNHRLQMIQEHKHRYLKMFLSKTGQKGVHLKHLREEILGLEERIRSSYSEELNFNQEELTNMMVLDGCFILMLFLVVSKKISISTDDPIFTLRWILPTLRCDLLLLENQVPLFILQDLLKTSKSFPSTSLNSIIFEFFGYSIERTEEFWEDKKDLQASHLLDLIRQTFIPNKSHQTEEQSSTNILCSFTCFNMLSPFQHEAQANTPPTPTPPIPTTTPPTQPPSPPTPPPTPPSTQPPTQIPSPTTPPTSPTSPPLTPSSPPSPQPEQDDSRFLGLVVSARKLQLRGIKFKLKKKSETPLDISLKDGVLEIPLLKFDDFFSSFLINCVAFEQFHMRCTTQMTSYVAFMGCLIYTAEDATFLNEKRIIENYFGTGEQISLFFKNISKDIAFAIEKSYLADVFEGINKYTSQGYRVQIRWAGIKYTYFNSPWAVLSTCAALLLLLLTIFQAFFTAYPYFYPPN